MDTTTTSRFEPSAGPVGGKPALVSLLHLQHSDCAPYVQPFHATIADGTVAQSCVNKQLTLLTSRHNRPLAFSNPTLLSWLPNSCPRGPTTTLQVHLPTWAPTVNVTQAKAAEFTSSCTHSRLPAKCDICCSSTAAAAATPGQGRGSHSTAR